MRQSKNAKKTIKKLKGEKNVVAKSSKVITEDFYKMQSHPKGQIENESEHEDVEEALETDEEIRGLYSFIVDSIMDAGFTLDGNKKDSTAAMNTLERVKFEEMQVQLYNNLVAHMDTFIEVIPSKAGNPLQLKIQPTKYVAPKITETGEILGYIFHNDLSSLSETQFNALEVTWKPEEIIHLQIDKIGTGFWTTTQIKTLKYWINLKRRVQKYIDWLYKTNQFKAHFHARKLSKVDTEAFIKALKEGEVQWDKWLVTAGEEDMQPRQISDPSQLDSHLKMLDECRNKILSLIRVPPIVAGAVDGSNRSNSDVQARFTFAKRIRRLLREIEIQLHSKMFPKLGIPSRVKLKFGAVDLRDDKENIDISLKLIGAGADKKMMLEWLNQRGLDLPDGLFDRAIEMEEKMQESQDKQAQDGTGDTNRVKLPSNSDLYPSRQPQDKGIENFKSGSEASTKQK